MIEHLHIKRLTPDSRFRNCDIRHIDFKPGINLLLGANTSVSLKTDWRIVPMGKHVNIGDKDD